MNKNEKYLISPYGEAQFPYLTEPDDRFPGQAKFKVNLVLDLENSDHAKYLSKLVQMGKAEVGDDAHIPIKDHKDRDGNLTGRKVVKFASTIPTKLYDRQNKPLEARVGMGSIIQVSAKPNFYKGIAGRSGMNLYLSAVKVRELVDPAPSTAAAFGFGQPDPELPEDDSPFAGEPPDVEAPKVVDEIPF